MVHVTSRICCTYKYPYMIHESMRWWWHGIISPCRNVEKPKMEGVVFSSELARVLLDFRPGLAGSLLPFSALRTAQGGRASFGVWKQTGLAFFFCEALSLL